MDELKKAIAFIFRMKGTGQLKESAMRDLISFDFRWFPPEDAKRLLALALEANLVTSKGGCISPNFDVAAVELPLTFKPGADVFSAPMEGEEKDAEREGEDLFIKILKKIEKKATLTREQLMSKINGVQGSMGVEIEVAALIVASDYDIDVKPLAKLAEDAVVSRYRGT